MKNERRSFPEAFRGRSLSVSLTVKDLKASLAWYRNVFGFTIHEKHERDGALIAVSLQAGNVRLLVGQDDGAKGSDRVKGEGFSMMITTAQDIDEVANGIRNRGGMLEVEPTKMPNGARFFRVRDLDGFRFTFSSISQSDA